MKEHLKKIITWANAVLESKDDDTFRSLVDKEFIKPRAPVQNFLVNNSPMPATEEHPWGDFAPNFFEAGHDGFRSLVLGILINEHGGSIQTAGPFAGKITDFSKQIEEFESWVTSPLNPVQLQALHTIYHETLYELAKENELEIDSAFWENDSKVTAERLTLAVIYILSWQKYSDCINFIWNMASPWFSTMSDVISSFSDDEEFKTLWNSMKCVHSRVHHFDGLLSAYDEGVEDYDQFNIEDDDEDDLKELLKERYKK